MRRLWGLLIDGCWHKWRATTQSRYTSDVFGEGPIVYVVCENCGRRSNFKNATMGDWE